MGKRIHGHRTASGRGLGSWIEDEFRGGVLCTLSASMMDFSAFDELAAIDAWIASSSDKKLTRAHAIRRLVALGLKAKTK
jgi:hypothetical protein